VTGEADLRGRKGEFMLKNGKLGVGIVGLGSVAAEHIKGYLANPRCEIVALVSRERQRAEATAEKLGLTQCRAYTALDQMLMQDNVDLVSICTPNHLHVEQGIAVAEAGRHLVMEKPVALTMDGARSLERAVVQAGIKNIVCFVLRWYPSFVNQLALVKSGAIGQVFFADCEYLQSHMERYTSQWRWIWKRSMGGSTLLHGGIHAVDAMRQFMAAPALEVTAYARRHTAQYKGDPAGLYEYPATVVGIVRFADGAVAKLTSTFEAAMPFQVNLRLYGSQGTIQNALLWSEVLSPAQNDWAHFPAAAVDDGDSSHQPFAPMVDHMVECILSDRPASPDISDALKSHEIAYAADISAEQGHPVRLPL
jgi:predicted dehydrogenase